MAELSDPHGYAASGQHCEEADCTLCSSAPGLIWKQGSFCNRGRWGPPPPAREPLDARWRDLPRELLPNIFARLPTVDIACVRTLSREWRAATSSDTRFTRQCGRLHRNHLAMIGFRDGTCWVRALDLDSRRWHAFDVPAVPALYRNAIRVFDGGFACFVPCGLGSNHDPVLILNPLTQEIRLLPLPNLVGNQPRMAHLRANPDTGTYTVTIVGHTGVNADLHHRWNQNTKLAAEVYNSESNSWTPSHTGTVLGFSYWWYKHSPTPMSMRMSVFNSRLARLAEYTSSHELHSSLAHHLDDLFLLQSWPGRVKVVKRARAGRGDEVVEKASFWKCHAFGTLRVCENFFLVLGNHVDREGAYFMMVYDRKNQVWSDDYAFDSKGCRTISPLDLYEFGIGELRWDARP